jgi:hypothetical protein
MYARTRFLYRKVKSTFWGEPLDATEDIDGVDAALGDGSRT